MKIILTAAVSILLACTGCAQKNQGKFAVTKSDAEWQKQLTPEQYEVTRQQGTETPFTGKYWNNHEKGIYKCVDCGQEVFSSDTKFESGTGWPSFWQPIKKQNVVETTDNSLGMEQKRVYF